MPTTLQQMRLRLALAYLAVYPDLADEIVSEVVRRFRDGEVEAVMAYTVAIWLPWAAPSFPEALRIASLIPPELVEAGQAALAEEKRILETGDEPDRLRVLGIRSLRPPLPQFDVAQLQSDNPYQLANFAAAPGSKHDMLMAMQIARWFPELFKIDIGGADEATD